MLGRILYRVRQFSNAAFAQVSEEDGAMTEELLTPALQQLFEAMPTGSQRHGLNVCHTLLRRGCTERDMLTAALLHDVGKGDIGLSHRIATVLLKRISPGLPNRLASYNPGGWRHGLFLNLHHADKGAEMVTRAGATLSVIDLVRNHDNKNSDDPRIIEFQQADGTN